MVKIAIIGAGNMGGALARGLAGSVMVGAAGLTVANPSRPKLDALKADFPEMKVTTDNVQALAGADFVILAVKPWKMAGVIAEIAPHIDVTRQAVVSVAGGMGTAEVSALFEQAGGLLPPLYYLIPNTAVAVRSGMTLMTSVRSTPERDNLLCSVFRELGDALLVEERLMYGGMILASCGIAFVMRYLRAMTEGGVQLGYYPDEALRIVMQTMRGAVDLLQERGTHPEAEIDRVTTPGGITIRGLNAMERAGFTNSVIEGLLACLPADKQNHK